jgi:hypothetical protein
VLLQAAMRRFWYFYGGLVHWFLRDCPATFHAFAA